MTKKKILIFSLAYYPHVGGAEVSVREITNRLPEFEFHMVTNRFDSTLPKVEQIGNVLVHRIGITTPHPSMGDLRKFPLHLNKFLFQFGAFFKAVLLHRKYGYGATWAVMAHSAGVPAALFKFFFPRVGFILNLQEGDPPSYIERKMLPLWPLFKRAFTSADVVQTLSTYLAHWAKKMGTKAPTVVVPNAVDAEHFTKEVSESDLNEIKDRLGKKMGDVFLITTSRLVHKNAVDDVIRALPQVPTNVHFIVLGVGPDDAKLKALSAKLSVSNRVHFMGFVSHEDIPKYLKASDIFIRPSRSEGFGASFAEAMVSGLPVIATQEGGLSDFLFDEKRNPGMPVTGWAVDSDAPTQIAEAIQEIMSKGEKVRAVTKTAKALVLEKYTWDVIAKTMREKVFAQLQSLTT